jgi:hypothetical protein
MYDVMEGWLVGCMSEELPLVNEKSDLAAQAGNVGRI